MGWTRENPISPSNVSEVSWSPSSWLRSCPSCGRDSSGMYSRREPCKPHRGKCDGSGRIKYIVQDTSGNPLKKIGSGNATFTPVPAQRRLKADEILRRRQRRPTSAEVVLGRLLDQIRA